MSPRIGVAIAGPTTEATLRAFDSVRGRADIVEIRLDLFQEPADLQRIIRERPCPVVVTCRAAEEGGSYQGEEAQRLATLREAAALGAEYVDVEWFAYPSLGPVESTVIVSRHDFTTMPDDLPSRWESIHDMGAGVVKLAGMASSAADILPILDVLAAANQPTIAMAMGEAGLASRVISARYAQSVLTYASLDDEGGTAPGQVPLQFMREVYRAHRITAATTFYGFIDARISAPLIRAFNRLLEVSGRDAVCVPLLAESVTRSLLDALLRHGFSGFHIHGPAQASVAGCLDQKDVASELLNSITLHAGSLVGTRVTKPEEQTRLWAEAAVE